MCVCVCVACSLARWLAVVEEIGEAEGREGAVGNIHTWIHVRVYMLLSMYNSRLDLLACLFAFLLVPPVQ